MLRRIVLASGAVTALALAITGCSSGKGSGPAAAPKTTAATGSSSVASDAASNAASDNASNAASPSASQAASSTSVASTSDAGRNAAAGNVDVCSLLTPAQASSLNKVTYGAPKAASPANNFKTCTYKNMGSKDPVDIQALTVWVVSIPGCWSQLQKADGPGKPVSGVGDAAFGTQIGIEVKAGSRCVEISGLTHAELLGKYGPDIAMAKIILAKLN